MSLMQPGASSRVLSLLDAPQNGIHLLNAVVIESRSAVVVRSLSLRSSGTPRRMDSISFLPPPAAHESTNVQPPFCRQ